MTKIGLTGPAFLALATIALSQIAADSALATANQSAPPDSTRRDTGASATPKVDSAPALARDSSVAAPPTDTVASKDSQPKGRAVPLVVRGRAPVGSQVTLDGSIARMDSTGRYDATLLTDSLSRQNGSYDLCLVLAGQNLCTKVRPQGFDTLDVAPLEVKIDSVVETRDTIRTVVDTTQFDSTALKLTDAPKVVKSSAGRTVTIRGKRRPPRVLGQERVTIQTIRRLPSLAEPDVMRAVQALPGVVQSSDFSTKVYVRGSASDQNLILFDNAAVYSPSHFGGLFSTFLADATGGLDFYKGGFDPRYGNRLASVLLVSSKVGGTERDSARDSTSSVRKFTDIGVRGLQSLVTGTPSDSLPKVKSQSSVRLTTFSGSVATDGQQGDASWAFAGRRTWIGSALALARALDATDLTLDYDFWDVQGSAAYGHAGDTVRASLYTGRDKLALGPISLEWGNVAAPVNIRKKLGTDWVLGLTGAYSKYDQDLGFTDVFNFKNSVESWNGRAELQWNPNPFHRVTGGYEFNQFDVGFTQTVEAIPVSYDSKTHSDLHAVYAQERWTIDTTKTLTAGVRVYNDPELVHDIYADPRLSFTWRFAPNWKADAHWGRYTQYMTSIRFADMELPSEFWYAAQNPMEPTSQYLTSFGVERSNFTKLGLRVGAESYYKEIKGVPLLVQTGTSQEEDKARREAGYDYFAANFQKLDGWAAGAEFALNKEDGWWTGSVSYALGWSVLHQRDFHSAIQDVRYSPYWADWDQRHTFKATGGLNWIGRKADEALSTRKMGVGNFLRSSFQLNLNSGLPMTDYQGYYRVHEPKQGVDGGEGSGLVTLVPGIDQNTVAVSNPRNVDRRPGYFRLDVTPIDWGRTGRWRFYYTIINITDAVNVYSINYNTRKNPPERSETAQFPRLPFFMGYEYQF